MADIPHNQNLSFGEKSAYALGDTASNLYWGVFSGFLIYFYTDVFGLPAAAVGTMMLLTRITDAFTDPMMGALADRTKTKFGKFRPYLLWGALPIAGAGVLTFTVPDISEDGKLIYAYVTYILMMMAYTFINIPYGALLGVITPSSQQRTMLASFRFIGAFTGSILVSKFTLVLVEWFGEGDEKLGWQLTMVLYGAIAILLFLVTFLMTKERIEPPQKQPTPVKQDILDLFKNKPWIVLFCLTSVIMVTITLRGSSGAFYFKYFVGREDLIGDFLTVYGFSLLIGAASAPLLTKLFDKKKLLVILMSAVAVLSFAFYFVPKDQIWLMFTLHALIGFCLGPKSPLVFSMYADTADYSQWKTGRRATAMIFSAASFSQKLGGALAGAFIGWTLGALGYVANQAQSAGSEHGIILLMSVTPGVFAIISVFVIRFYPLDKTQMETLHQELKYTEKGLN
ncbi:MFS transporter [Paraglaciecola aquimarina]|uniref:MFS transporter n=1 Tax=Paraglaciecola algarum TaxID=3050085 RepID=A0ABS9DAF2_9ALTE|nr:MFS transporter [Paraglaciecola sp. G1-23]MCF2949729.1 MFS transporter [Paraglaciecola sp. G1-23]